MEPRIDSGEYVVINTLAYRFGAPARGDIVAFRHERSAPSVYLKRVIGIPGDRIAIERGYVSVNGVRLDEPYVRFRDTRSDRCRHGPAARVLRARRQSCKQRRLARLGIRRRLRRHRPRDVRGLAAASHRRAVDR